MELQFTKMHGAGNDFVFLDCLKKNVDHLETIAKKLCDRRFGIGADQLLTVHPSKVADFKMEIYNADGSQVEMCGNGIRCFAKYVYDHGITQKRELEVETLAGIIRPKIVGELVEVDMGEPILDGRKIPVDADGEIKNRPLTVDGKTYESPVCRWAIRTA
jgi:diaminopimelate epimerase